MDFELARFLFYRGRHIFFSADHVGIGSAFHRAEEGRKEYVSIALREVKAEDPQFVLKALNTGFKIPEGIAYFSFLTSLPRELAGSTERKKLSNLRSQR